MNVITLHKPYYPKLFRLFYTNLVVEDEPLRLKSMVKPKEILIDENLLSDLFKIPNKGSKIEKCYGQMCSPF